MKKTNMLKKHKKKILFIIYFIIFILYIIRPINFDAKIYLGTAYQANLIGSFPINLLEAWEHKLVLNRFFFYCIFKIVNLFISPNKIILFEFISKLIYGLISVSIIKIFTKYTEDFFKKFNINKDIVFGSLYLTIMFTDFYFDMQTEITAILILMIAIIFILKQKTIYKIIGALIISSLFFLKGVTLLYSIIVLIIMILDKQKVKDIIFTIVMSIIFLMTEVSLIYILCPQEILEFILSSQYITNELKRYNILEFYFYNIIKNVYIFIGMISLIINIYCYKKTKNIKLLILELLAWILLTVGIYIQKMRYLYQIALIIPACLLSFYICTYYIKNKVVILKKWIKLLILYLAVVVTIVMMLNITEKMLQVYSVTKKDQQVVEKIKEQIPDLTENEILYIGNGLSSYYIKAKSYTKYTATIYLSNNNETYKNNEYIKELKEKVKTYGGKYIIVDDEEIENKRRISDDIIKFIDENYNYLQSSGIMIYENEQENVKHKYSSIYVKK